MLLLLRILHILIGSFFILCLIYLYYAAFTRTLNPWVYFALVAIIIEGLILKLNDGHCPFTKYQKKLGDTKGFFDLFLPPKALPLAVPVFSVLTAIAVLIIYYNHFW
jgi:hypothetical protein